MQQHAASIPQIPPRPPSLVGIHEVASDLAVSRRTVDHLIAKGLPHIRLGPRKNRFDLGEVRSWIRRNFRVSRMAGRDRKLSKEQGGVA